MIISRPTHQILYVRYVDTYSIFKPKSLSKTRTALTCSTIWYKFISAVSAVIAHIIYNLYKCIFHFCNQIHQSLNIILDFNKKFNLSLTNYLFFSIIPFDHGDSIPVVLTSAICQEVWQHTPAFFLEKRHCAIYGKIYKLYIVIRCICYTEIFVWNINCFHLQYHLIQIHHYYLLSHCPYHMCN